MVRRDNPHAPALEENVWHDGALDGTNVSAAASCRAFPLRETGESLNLRPCAQTIVVHAGEGSSAMRAEGRQWVALLNKRTDGAEDAMMWKATGTVAVGAWPLLQ